MDFLVRLIVGLIPPKDDDPMKVYIWRWKTIMLGFATLAIACYASNLIPFLKPPYAMANDVQASNVEVQRQIDQLTKKTEGTQLALDLALAQIKEGQVRSLTTDLIEATRYKCRAKNSDGGSSLPFWTRRWQDLKVAYYSLTGTLWPEVPCDSF